MRKNKKLNKKPLIGIIGGKGKMGAWFNGFFENQGFKVLVSDVKTKFSNVELAKKADIVIVSVPIGNTVRVIKEVRDFVRKDALLCDITSLKEEPVEAMRKAKSGVLGMHPLFGPLVQNLEGQKFVFCGVKNNQWVDFLRKIFVKNKAEIIEVSPEEHDKQMAIVQALIHFTNIGLARTLYSQKIIPKSSFLTPVFRLQILIIGRILGQNPELYAELEIRNPYFKNVLIDFENQIKDLSKDVRDKNLKSFVKKFKQTSLYLDGFRKVSQTKSTEVLRIINRQPIKIKQAKKIINLKSKIKIGFLGPKGTFSHQAVRKVFPQKSKFITLGTIKEIFEKVNSQEIDLGIAPAENTIGGIVSETINCLAEYPLKISGSFNIAVHHCFLARTKNKKEIKTVKTHPQALSQCRDWLARNLPRVKLETSSSTTAPILENQDKEVGFIAGEIAAKEYGLNILAKNIEDSKDNFTKFYLITPDINKKFQKKLKAEKTLLLLAVYNRVGILRDILDVFAQNNLNLTSLHSIPSHLRPWDYFFFLEADVSYPCPEIKKTIKQIEKYCSIIRVIGVS
ncbi:prephenate dehydrogenase/arogenate dehydrogenase family protein [Candidatus Parcubacteria bacterium]|nr:prephenate dehydrogenase/arogenate dehydrogenase family protein [Candidatus Parcubacteria bacterium]